MAGSSCTDGSEVWTAAEGDRSVEAQTASSRYYCEMQSVIKMENLQ